ncbi:Gfo/Idh/MocA family protein [Adhaeretor mobilis]|uniref:Glucose--fructose oxidoreductase n=1 Tax=Adhaeretor mobilis TaxID=1930276 RepID=A0A517N2M9_9BACT|nr:Gfo/Idh/MocA family oxidoreductase [Adhaeretor mobilis]QDT01383.1 Glucose--fructose oxidoreductase precursor [Adhaeretor mobilis]
MTKKPTALLSQGTTRRGFLSTTAAGVGYWVAGGVQAQTSKMVNGGLQIACVGVGGKGKSDTKNASRFGKIYAMCDVDRRTLKGTARQFKTEHTFTDYRELFDQLGDKVDAVTVSTPDHTHAVIASKAMKMGKHVYCQKPLTHSIHEARQLQNIAREMGVVTQMGNQFTAFDPMRKTAYQVRSGQLGDVSDVHVWTNRPVWPQGEDRQPDKPVPDSLDWESWIGPAPMRPYADGYHDFKWRGWWDFGTGALGDMACHTVNMPYMALTMRDPTSITAETSGHNGDSYPEWSRIKFEFPELDGRAAFTLHWYDGSQLPPTELTGPFLSQSDGDGKPAQLDNSGCIMVGSKGKLYAAGDYAQAGIYWSDADGEKLEPREVDYPNNMGGPELGHVKEFYAGIATGDPHLPVSNMVDYSGPLTETILLGNLAVWKGGKVEWDAKKAMPVNDPELEKIVRRDYRDGYTL